MESFRTNYKSEFQECAKFALGKSWNKLNGKGILGMKFSKIRVYLSTLFSYPEIPPMERTEKRTTTAMICSFLKTFLTYHESFQTDGSKNSLFSGRALGEDRKDITVRSDST